MKVNELMIGDWVQDKYMHIRFQIFKISDKTVNHAPHSDSGFLEEEIEPIPITPEILEKNNIVKSDNSSFYECENGKQRIKVLIPKSQKPFLDVNNDFECNVMMNFEYVHELQRALRFCKIDKEIKL